MKCQRCKKSPTKARRIVLTYRRLPGWAPGKSVKVQVWLCGPCAEWSRTELSPGTPAAPDTSAAAVPEGLARRNPVAGPQGPASAITSV